MLVVDHDDVEIARTRDADGGDAAEAHQLLAVAGQGEDALARLGLRQVQAPISAAPPMAPQR